MFDRRKPERFAKSFGGACWIKVYKELERIIKEKNIGLSVGKTLEVAKTITTIRVKMPENGKFYTKTMFLTEKHRVIQDLFDLENEI